MVWYLEIYKEAYYFMKKMGLFCLILTFLTTRDVTAEQCTVLSDAEYTKMYTNHSTTIKISVLDDLEENTFNIQWDMLFQDNGNFSSVWYPYQPKKETMRYYTKGNWHIHNSILYMSLSDCHYTKSKNDSINKDADEFCAMVLDGTFNIAPVTINPCNPFSM